MGFLFIFVPWAFFMDWKEKRQEDLRKAKELDRRSQHPQYRPIPNFPQYRVGDDGSVWSFRWDRKEVGRWKRLKGARHRQGYIRIWLHDGQGRVKVVLLHRLVMEVFIGPCPPGEEACHNDDNPTNNSIWNLRWDTRSENQRDRKWNRLMKS